MSELEIAPLDIEIWLLVHAHAVDSFLGIERLKSSSEMVVASKMWLEFTLMDVQRACIRVSDIEPMSRILFEDHFVFAENGNLASLAHCRFDASMLEGACFIGS